MVTKTVSFLGTMLISYRCVYATGSALNWPMHFVPFKQGTFITLDTLMGMSIVQKGSGFPFFAPSVYSYISRMDLWSITVAQEEIPHAGTCAALLKVPNSIPCSN